MSQPIEALSPSITREKKLHCNHIPAYIGRFNPGHPYTMNIVSTHGCSHKLVSNARLGVDRILYYVDCMVPM